MSELPLRVAFLAGTLERGGAEKQLVYMVEALARAGADVRVHTLRGGPHEAALRSLGLPPIHVGRHESPMIRLLAFASATRAFQPHVIQAAHFYTNLYVAFAAKASGALGIGAIRGDPVAAARANGRWGTPLLRLPCVLFVNSEAARLAAIAMGVSPGSLHVIPNVIAAGPPPPSRVPASDDGAIVATLVGSLSSHKRVDRFLEALALARRTHPALVGRIVGAGPEREALVSRAAELGLGTSAVAFVGQVDDVRRELERADMLVLASDHEGFPNVILEAMAAGLPVVTTDVGDAGVIVRHGVTGFVTDVDAAALAERMSCLAADFALRVRLGQAGRIEVEAKFGTDRLAGWLLAAYRSAAGAARMPKVFEAVPA